MYKSLPKEPVIFESNGEQLNLKEEYEKILDIENKVMVNKFKIGEYVWCYKNIYTITNINGDCVTIQGIHFNELKVVVENSKNVKRLWFQNGDKFISTKNDADGYIVKMVGFYNELGSNFVTCDLLWDRSHLPSVTFELEYFCNSGDFKLLDE